MALGCDQGWFGSNCQFKCHCKQSNLCSYQGECSNGGKCDEGWFGPSCQYYDLARSRDLNTAKTTDIQTVTDGDDLTCQPVVSNMTFTWTHSYLITWIRIITSNSGRNVALKQMAKQSSTFEHTGYDYTFTSEDTQASNAVDGNTSPKFSDKSYVQCEIGRFGLECNSTCNCRTAGEACVVSTGACPAGCALGFHGVGCNEACPPTMWDYECASTCNINCLNKSCNSQTGHCMYGCIDGYTGFTCAEGGTLNIRVRSQHQMQQRSTGKKMIFTLMMQECPEFIINQNSITTSMRDLQFNTAAYVYIITQQTVKEV
ncbi:platelet endothelial aggregation receptor 1-like [Physella acuta]|uniref:platelet endothelial aggregation receptor 1-like n=1 Tax=Physella acuta TaxID=109671 RepID=UPI0027DCB4E8|nr:platelet endothelial aggregation receptor 1-like [Physella acuta]